MTLGVSHQVTDSMALGHGDHLGNHLNFVKKKTIRGLWQRQQR